MKGGDFLDGTPVLDIKPYVPYADSILDARADFASTAPKPVFRVEFTDEARRKIDEASREVGQDLLVLVSQLLAFDPRPAFYAGSCSKERFVSTLYEYDLTWVVSKDVVLVSDFQKQA